MYVAWRMQSSSESSPKKFWRKALTLPAASICLIAEYLDVAMRARHSSHSSKSSTACSAVASAWPTPSCSTFCESMKAALHVGIERRTLMLPLVDSSPVISDICSISHSPTMSCRSSTRSHSSKPSLSEMTPILGPSESSDTFLSYHSLSFGLYESSAPMTLASCISFCLKAAEFSRLARGRMISLRTDESANATGTSSSLLPCSPKFGLARQKAMRTSMLRNSYSTSSWSFLASPPSLAPLTLATGFFFQSGTSLPRDCASRFSSCRCARTCAVLVALALMNCVVMTSNLYCFVSRPTSTTKSWNSSSDISMASSALSSEMERVYARKMSCSSLKSGCMMSCTSFSHVGHRCTSMISMRSQHATHLSRSACDSFLSGLVSLAS
mmetsp:Transcript_13614/g.34994  ORF Transcript_13614/g.34994 Transcript_13614/m.34994 type:complete len:384 (+) Transcript_13614:106-1257(+)